MNVQEIDKEFCGCGNLLKHVENFNFRNNSPDAWITGDPHYQVEWLRLMRCPACCSTTILLYSAWGNEDAECGDDPQSLELGREYRREVIYGPVKRLELHSSIPSSIRDVLEQAEAVISSSPRASFILCRAALEELCCEFRVPDKVKIVVNSDGSGKPIPESGKKSGSLHHRIFHLFSQEKLPDELREVAINIKDLGNEGAHSRHSEFSDKVATEDAESMVALTKYLLERLYVDKWREKEAQKSLASLVARIQPRKAKPSSKSQA